MSENPSDDEQVTGTLTSDRLAQNWAHLRALLDEAEALRRTGRLEDAAVAAQVAATFAWFNHAGIFSSEPLENLLRKLGQSIPRSAAVDGRVLARSPQKVLHVVTQLYPTGGHTQMIARWVERDADRIHNICVTAQRGRPIPDKISRLAGLASLTVLDSSYDSLLMRTAALRRVSATADRVILHIHPNDVVPSMAFADRQGPPVIYVNHADHVFWQGTLASNVIMNLRRSGAELAVERRGLDPARCATIIRPLTLRSRTASRVEAKRSLGIDPDRVVLATAASGSKYEPVDGVGLLDLIRPILIANPQAYLLAGGPSPTGRWQELDDDGLGRALGELLDVAPLLEAADVYIDSYPFSSLTSMLEAGSSGTPVVTYRGAPPDCAVLGADTPELDREMVVCANPASYQQELTRLINDSGRRKALGEQTRAAIADAQGGSAWNDALDRMYALAAARTDAPVMRPAPRRSGELDQRVACVQSQTGFSTGVLGAKTHFMDLMPLRTRVALWLQLVRAGRGPHPKKLMSASVVRRVKAARRRVLRAHADGNSSRR